MDKFCEDCIHNLVCQYGAYCPSGHCNDKDTLDDLRPNGEQIVKGQDIYCSICNQESAYNAFGASKFSNFCPNCGAKMRKGGAV